MTNPLDEQRAAHVEVLRYILASQYETERPWEVSWFRIERAAIEAGIAALTNPLQFVEFPSADALATWLESLHETDGPAVTGNKFAPAQRAAAAIRAGDTLTAPPLCAKGAAVWRLRVSGSDFWSYFPSEAEADAYAAKAAMALEKQPLYTTLAQPRREVTDAEVESALIALHGDNWRDGRWAGWIDAQLFKMRAALESFANGGDS